MPLTHFSSALLFSRIITAFSIIPSPRTPITSTALKVVDVDEDAKKAIKLRAKKAKERVKFKEPTATIGRPGERAGDDTAVVNNTVKLVGQHGSALLPSNCDDNKAEVSYVWS